MLLLPRRAGVLLAMGLFAAAAALAQPYRSALEGYRPFADEEPVPWKQANDTVGRIGGWRAYAKEAQGTPAAAPASSPASAPASAPARPPQPQQHRH
jgi:hypothetical protein